MDVTRTFDLLSRYRERSPKEDALCFKHNGAWIKYSSQDYIDYSYNFCYGLYELGFRKGDKIITVSSNRPEWNFADMGMSMLGVVHVPVFTSLNASEYEYIINNSGAKMVLVSDNKLFCCLSPALKNSDHEVLVYTFDNVPNARSWTEIINKGKSCAGETVQEVEKIKAYDYS